MRSRASGITSMLLLIMATSSLISMFVLLQIDGIIRRDLYMFSYQLALPYWTMTTIIFAVGWFNIIAAVALQLYMYVNERREARITSRQNGVPDEIPQKQTQEEQSMESTGSENLSREEFNLPKGLEQKVSSREEEKDIPISVNARAVEGIGLTDAEELIFNGANLYFHPDTPGRSFKTDFPDREFKQSELKRLYREKRINKDEYVEGLIKAFPLRLEEDVSNKILDYLEGWLERMNNTEDSLAIVRECRQDKKKWNILWEKMCRQYETELQQEALAA